MEILRFVWKTSRFLCALTWLRRHRLIRCSMMILPKQFDTEMRHNHFFLNSSQHHHANEPCHIQFFSEQNYPDFWMEASLISARFAILADFFSQKRLIEMNFRNFLILFRFVYRFINCFNFFFSLPNKTCTSFRHCKAHLQYYVKIEFADMNRLKATSYPICCKKNKWSDEAVW